MQTNAYSRYQEQSVMTMTRADMLLKLYDETVKQLHNGVHFIKEKDMASADKCLQKAQNILQYLSSTLDRKYPISNNLASLYRFFKDQIMAASIHRDTKPLESITPMISELRDAFAQADKQLRIEQQPQHSSEMVG